MFRFCKITIKLLSLVSFVGLASCSSQIQHQYSNLDQLKFAADPKNSTYTSYDLTDAVWVHDQPLLVNKDFNFGMAMSIEGSGTAIAVGMRNNKNKALAEKLKILPPLELDQDLEKHLAQHNSLTQNYNINVFAMLYGQPKANLQTFVELMPSSEVADNKNPLQRIVYVSDWLDIDGDQGWLANNGELIKSNLEISLQEIAVILKEQEKNDNNYRDSESIKYSIQGGESVKRGAGIIAGRNDGRVLIWDDNVASTLVSYPVKVVEFD